MDDYRVGVLVYVIYTYYLIFTSINSGLVSAWRHLWSCFFFLCLKSPIRARSDLSLRCGPRFKKSKTKITTQPGQAQSENKEQSAKKQEKKIGRSDRENKRVGSGERKGTYKHVQTMKQTLISQAHVLSANTYEIEIR